MPSPGSIKVPSSQKPSEEMPRYMSGVSARRAEETIAALNAACGADAPGSERRREPRDPCDGQFSVKVAIRTTGAKHGGPTRTVFVEVFARNLSNSGFGFVAPPIYLPEAKSQTSIAVRGDDVFTIDKIIQVAIVRREGALKWMKARVVRARVVDDGFVECGVEFI